MVHGWFKDGLGPAGGPLGVPLVDGWGPAGGRVLIWTSPAGGPLDGLQSPNRVEIYRVNNRRTVGAFTASSCYQNAFVNKVIADLYDG